jgi:hypothetical protein
MNKMHRNVSLTIGIFAVDEEYLLYTDKSFFNSQILESSKIKQDKQNVPYLEMLLLLKEYLLYTSQNQLHKKIMIMMLLNLSIKEYR